MIAVSLSNKRMLRNMRVQGLPLHHDNASSQIWLIWQCITSVLQVKEIFASSTVFNWRGNFNDFFGSISENWVKKSDYKSVLMLKFEHVKLFISQNFSSDPRTFWILPMYTLWSALLWRKIGFQFHPLSVSLETENISFLRIFNADLRTSPITWIIAGFEMKSAPRPVSGFQPTARD